MVRAQWEDEGLERLQAGLLLEGRLGAPFSSLALGLPAGLCSACPVLKSSA